jgi:hypothetical protein
MPTTTTTQRSPKVAAIRHPLYDLFIGLWRKLADVREGLGGFLDGTYLAAHPREWLDHTLRQTVTNEDGTTSQVTATNPNPKKPSAKLKARRAIASYNNTAAAIIEAYKGPLFRESPNRRVGDAQRSPDAQPTPIEQWWDDIYRGKSINEMMPTWWDVAASQGHNILLFEIPNTDPPADGEVLTAADQAMPKVCWYAPQDVINWLEDDDGRVTAIKVLEAVPAASFDETVVVSTQYRVRVVDDTQWTLYDSKGGVVDSGEHNLGRVPFVYLFGQRRPGVTTIGKSILGDPQNHIDLYNLESEKREILRNATFPFLNVPLGTGADAMTVTEAQTMMGQQNGTMNIVFSAQPAAILQPDSTSVDAYEVAISSKRREIYRESGVQWEADSRDAEAAGSLKLKREDMVARLSEMANECQAAEYELADLFYRWRYGADQGPQRLEKDKVTIQYPNAFEKVSFEDLQAQIEAAQSIGMPGAVLKELRKTILTKFEGMASLPPQSLQDLMDEIDAMPDDPTPQERVQQKMQILAAAAKGKDPSVPAEAKNLGKEAA